MTLMTICNFRCLKIGFPDHSPWGWMNLSNDKYFLKRAFIFDQFTSQIGFDRTQTLLEDNPFAYEIQQTEITVYTPQIAEDCDLHFKILLDQIRALIDFSWFVKDCSIQFIEFIFYIPEINRVGVIANDPPITNASGTVETVELTGADLQSIKLFSKKYKEILSNRSERKKEDFTVENGFQKAIRSRWSYNEQTRIERAIYLIHLAGKPPSYL